MAFVRSSLLCTAVLILLGLMLTSGNALTTSICENPKLLLVASTVKDGDILAAAANGRTIVIQYDTRTTTLDSLLDSARSALGGRKAASIAIAAHDYGEAKFYLTGEHTISLGSSLISEEQQDFWRGLGGLVIPNGRVDLLACDLAATDEGHKLVDVLAGYSGVPVAASSNKTGNPASSGDWLLETANVDIADIYFAPDRLAAFTDLLVSERQKLTASDGAESDYFGFSVAIDGDRMIIGAIRDDDNGDMSGSAYVFRETAPDTWTEVAKLTASDGAAEDKFGSSVSISGDSIVISASSDDDNGSRSGSAYVFRETATDTWTEVSKLTASDGAADDFFGSSVSISGDSIVIGAYGNDDNGDRSGSAYVFRETATDTWTEVAKLTASDAAADDYFGSSVSISGERIVISAYGNEDDGTDSGSAYVFRETATDTWTEVAKLTASDGAALDAFGFSVAVEGDSIVVGTKYDNDYGSDSGSAYVFRETATDVWSEVAKLTASDGAAYDYLGHTVAIFGDLIVIGAYGDDDYGSYSGSAYVFRETATDSWNQVNKLTASDSAATDQLGKSVAISGDRVVVGAEGDADYGSFAGSAYTFLGPKVTVNSVPSGSTDRDGETQLRFGDGITITATPVANYDFGVWSGDASGSDNPLTINNITDNLDITPVFFRHTGLLNVNFTADGSGPSYSISGPADFNGGTPLVGQTGNYSEVVPTGTYTVTFTAPANFDRSITASSFTVTGSQVSGNLTLGATQTIDAVYTRHRGTLNVNISADGGSGSYSISGPVDFNGGTPLTGQTGNYSAAVPTGTYAVTFTTRAGYLLDVTATGFTVIDNQAQGSLALGATQTVAGVYIRSTGSLRATLLGTKKGGWKLEMQSDWRKSGVIQSGIPVEDNYTVVFKHVSGFETPEPQHVDILPNTLTDITAIYVEEGKDTGSVTIVDPDNDAPDGSAWRPILGGSAPSAASGWFAFGETAEGLPEGDLTIEFYPVIGHITPADMYITVKAGESIRVNADYLRPFIAASADYNGDGHVDPAVYDPDTRMWSVVCGTDGHMPVLDKRFGGNGIIPAPADYDGDGITDRAYYNPTARAWRVSKQFNLKNFGEKDDIPVPGDYLGLGHDQPALYRSGDGLWLIHDGSNLITLDFGGTYDIPAPADYDGDGAVDLGVYDVRTGRWRVAIRKGDTTWRQKSSLGAKNFGSVGDIPMPADYDGDGAADIALYRPADNVWRMNIEGSKTIVFGRMGDIPVSADWNNDGAADIAIFRPRNGTWQAIGDIFKARHGKECRPLISSAR